MDQSARFWDRTAEKYSKQPVAHEDDYQRKLEITRGYFTPETEVVEFGCGTGSTALLHAPHVKHILATDFSSKMLEIAQRKAEAQGVDNVTFERTSIEELNVPDQTIDVVLGLSILHLLEDKEAAIAKVHRMLKQGGVFVTSTACIGDMNPIFRPIISIGRLFGLVPLVKVFTGDELLKSLAGAGFSIEHEWRPRKNRGIFIVAKKAD